MTVMAVEAAPAAAEATTGAIGARSGGAAATAGRGKHAARKPSPEAKARDTAAAEEAAGQRKKKRARDRIPRQKISRTNYQPVILMEFVAVILLTAATPIARKKGQPGLSPYEGKDIVKLASLTVVYLILAMISVGGRTPGRWAAWFGGLILLTDGLFEASSIVKDLQLLGGGGLGGKKETPATEPGGILPTPSGTQPSIFERSDSG